VFQIQAKLKKSQVDLVIEILGFIAIVEGVTLKNVGLTLTTFLPEECEHYKCTLNSQHF
jgi:hypothetical protein